MTMQVIDFEAYYAAGLRRSAPLENKAVFGAARKVPTPQEELCMIDAWKASAAALTDEPQTIRQIAAITEQHVETVRKHLGKLRLIGVAANGPRKPMPQGGFISTWIKGKEPTK